MMTDAEMAEALRAKGWTCEQPVAPAHVAYGALLEFDRESFQPWLAALAVVSALEKSGHCPLPGRNGSTNAAAQEPYAPFELILETLRPNSGKPLSPFLAAVEVAHALIRAGHLPPADGSAGLGRGEV